MTGRGRVITEIGAAGTGAPGSPDRPPGGQAPRLQTAGRIEFQIPDSRALQTDARLLRTDLSSQRRFQAAPRRPQEDVGSLLVAFCQTGLYDEALHLSDKTVDLLLDAQLRPPSSLSCKPGSPVNKGITAAFYIRFTNANCRTA